MNSNSIAKSLKNNFLFLLIIAKIIGTNKIIKNANEPTKKITLFNSILLYQEF
jgi:hypothetical protein